MTTLRTGVAFVPLTADAHPDLQHLTEYRQLADACGYCGVPLVDMTRDELLAFAAMCGAMAFSSKLTKPLLTPPADPSPPAPSA